MFKILRSIVEIFGSADNYRETGSKLSRKDRDDAENQLLDWDRSAKEKKVVTKKYRNK